jgi:hypothetical protein
MSKQDELSGFKISDRRRPEVRAFGATVKAGAAAAEPEPAASSGFPAVEERLEKGNIESVADELRAVYEKLEALSNGKDMKLKGPAKKAMAAYERTADLFEYLFATKGSIGPAAK